MLLTNPVKESNRHIFVAAEKKIPRVRIETRQAAVLTGQRIIVAIDSWPRTSRYPLGHFVRALGKTPSLWQHLHDPSVVLHDLIF